MLDLLYVIHPVQRKKMTIHVPWIQILCDPIRHIVDSFRWQEREKERAFFQNTTVLDTVVPPRRSDKHDDDVGGKTVLAGVRLMQHATIVTTVHDHVTSFERIRWLKPTVTRTLL